MKYRYYQIDDRTTSAYLKNQAAEIPGTFCPFSSKENNSPAATR